MASNNPQVSQKELAAINYCNDIIKRFRNQPETINKYQSVMRDVISRRFTPEDIIDRIKTIFHGHDDLIVRFDCFFPSRNCTNNPDEVEGEEEVTVSDEGGAQKYSSEEESNKRYECALNFLNKVRTRDADVYRNLLKVYSSQKMAGMKLDELQVQFSLILEKYDDLLEEFVDNFLEPHQGEEATPMEVDRMCPDRERNEQEEIQKSDGLNLFAKIKEKLPMGYEEVLAHVYNYTQEKLRRDELDSVIELMLANYPDLVDEFKLYMNKLEGICETSPKRNTKDREGESPKERYSNKPIYELDLPKSKNSTPSYRLLPHCYPLPATSGRTEHERAVLNDHWVVYNSADYSNKCRRLPTDLEKMHKIEKEMYQMDMFESWLKSAIEYAEKKLACNDEEPEGFNIKEIHFKRWIEKLYGENGEQAVECYEKYGREALPIMLQRLQEKLQSWEIFRRHYRLTFC